MIAPEAGLSIIRQSLLDPSGLFEKSQLKSSLPA
jgi:hypothetical protein